MQIQIEPLRDRTKKENAPAPEFITFVWFAMAYIENPRKILTIITVQLD